MLDRDAAGADETKRITSEVIRALRASVYNDGVVEAGEVERLFTLDETGGGHHPEWPALFIEAVTDYIVEQAEPQGYVSEANADWLIERIARDGRVNTATEFELLVKVLEKARSSPDRLSAFALGQVKAAVLKGEGPLAGPDNLERGRVGQVAADLIRRILYAFGGSGAIAVSRAEAEMLFDINDACAGADNDPAWSDLFVKAIANFTMAASGYQAPSREEAMRREAWLDAPSGGVADLFSRMVAGGLRGILQSYGRPGAEDAWAARNDKAEADMRDAEAVTAAEAEWLARRMGRDGVLHDNEKALLRFIRDEAPSVHPSLQSLIAKAA